MKIKSLVAVAALAASIPAFAADVATVNGKPISQDDLDIRVKAMGTQGIKDSDQLRQALLADLIDREVLRQEAEKKGLDKKDEYKRMVSEAQKDLLATTLMQDFYKNNPVSDKEVKEAYDKLAAEASEHKEYKVRHILVKDEAEANKLLKQIKSKKISFKEAAKKSIDQGSAAEGGELGWSQAESYVTEFAEAVKRAKKGELLDKPVKTKFGWHIIEVEDSRDAQIPQLKEVEAQIKHTLAQQKFKAYVNELHDKAKIENKLELKDKPDADAAKSDSDKADKSDKSDSKDEDKKD